jgi:hypothetical protein
MPSGVLRSLVGGFEVERSSVELLRRRATTDNNLQWESRLIYILRCRNTRSIVLSWSAVSIRRLGLLVLHKLSNPSPKF